MREDALVVLVYDLWGEREGGLVGVDALLGKGGGGCLRISPLLNGMGVWGRYGWSDVVCRVHYSVCTEYLQPACQAIG